RKASQFEERAMKDRRAILDEHGMRLAPPNVQRAFWGRYNLRSKGRTGKLGDYAALLLSDEALRATRRLQSVREAWLAVVPAEFASRTDVESLRSGCLRISVDSASTRFVMARSIGATVLVALRARLAGTRI